MANGDKGKKRTPDILTPTIPWLFTCPRRYYLVTYYKYLGGVCRPLSKTLTLFKTKIYDFHNLINDGKVASFKRHAQFKTKES